MISYLIILFYVIPLLANITIMIIHKIKYNIVIMHDVLEFFFMTLIPIINIVALCAYLIDDIKIRKIIKNFDTTFDFDKNSLKDQL